MRIVFAGSSEYAIPILEELVSTREHEIPLVISQPARPKGRKLQAEDTPLAASARLLDLELYTPEDVNDEESIARITAVGADIIVTASYGAFLGKTLRQICPLGAINLHPSLLPKYRGSSPIRAALLAGERVTGNSIFRLVKKMDAGPLLLQEELAIHDNENYSSLHDRLANHAAQLLPRLLRMVADLPAREQSEEAASYSRMVTKTDLKLDFSHTTAALLRQIRAYSFEPGTYTMFRGRELKILCAQQYADTSKQEPGSICQIIKNEGFTIATGDGEILIRQVQAAGKKRMDAWTFTLGARFTPGERISI
ncbi:MAG TPA: methionyl-tRNA formyltransferase [Candidatus Cloacimonadota bacterium]|nr:methionyl-tRNA formyltransferase [Candidatus Cloacimonadota bacterium]